MRLQLVCCLIVFVNFEQINTVKLPIFLQFNQTDGVCGDFYSYACHSWHKSVKKPDFEPIWNPWLATSYEIKNRLSKILSHHNPTLKKPQIFYRSCLRIIENEAKYLRELLRLVDELGGWPLVETNWLNANFDWFQSLAVITKEIVVYPILRIHKDLDYVNPENLVIYIEPGNLIFPQYILTGTIYGIELKAYEKWISDTIQHMYTNSTNIKSSDIKNLIHFEQQLAHLISHKSHHKRTNLKNVRRKLNFDMLAGLQLIFDDSTINENTTVAIRNWDFFKNLLVLLETTDKKIIANYLIWSVIKDLSRETTNHMRDLNFLIDQAILGVQDDITREFECLDSIINYFSTLLLPSYLKYYVNPKKFTIVGKIFNELKNQFVEILSKSWLSNKAKKLLIVKIQKIQLIVGFEADSLNDHYYRELKITNNHFTNVLKLKKLKRSLQMKWPSSPFDVNAYYSVLQNSVFVPLGLLEPPFFQLFRDDIINVARLGVLIGHEISHALDPTGIMADSNGKIRNWLPSKDYELYKQRIECFGGNVTIGENFADLNGLNLSLHVAKKWNLGNLDTFFKSYAQMWCEISDTELFPNDEHSTNHERIENLLKNSAFIDFYQCEEGRRKSYDLWGVS